MEQDADKIIELIKEVLDLVDTWGWDESIASTFDDAFQAALDPELSNGDRANILAALRSE